MKNSLLIVLIFTVVLLQSCNFGTNKGSQNNSNLPMGCNLDQVQFDKAQVFEPLATSLNENGLPTKVSLLSDAPSPRSQGNKGSCTAWATCYNAGSILWATAKGVDANSLAFSPDFIYNQMTQGNCTGTNIGEALKLIQEKGLVPLSEFPYDASSCDKQPSGDIEDMALQYRIKGFNRLTLAGEDYRIDLQAIKQNLAQGAPVVVGMYVGGSFYEVSQQNNIWMPDDNDYEMFRQGKNGHIVDDGSGSAFGGHAMCVTGYDENKQGGCFQILNSWGSDWGDNGMFWMKYKDFEYFVNEFYGEAYGLYPIKKKEAAPEYDFQAAIGLLINKSDKYIAFEHEGGNLFTTTETLSAGTKFKIAVRNDVECYTYVFGQETDGSSYVLFPYTEKHSPYCGITGTRLFPKDYSLQLDNLGSKDVMAVVFTKEEIDFQQLNADINSGAGSTYEQKLRNALGNSFIENVKFTDGEKIVFKAKSNGKNAVIVVFEINKQ